MGLADKIQHRLATNIERDHALNPQETTELAMIATESEFMVRNHVGEAPIPEIILELAGYEVARELYTRRDAPGGVLSTFGDVGPVRLARDPMRAAYPILAPYLTGGFA